MLHPLEQTAQSLIYSVAAFIRISFYLYLSFSLTPLLSVETPPVTLAPLTNLQTCLIFSQHPSLPSQHQILYNLWFHPKMMPPPFYHISSNLSIEGFHRITCIIRLDKLDNHHTSRML